MEIVRRNGNSAQLLSHPHSRHAGAPNPEWSFRCGSSQLN